MIEAAAAEWLVKHDRGLNAAEQDSFLQWLAAAAAHREAFERHRAMWRDFDALAQWRPEHSAEPNPDLLARPRSRAKFLAHWPWAVGLAAAMAVVASLEVQQRWGAEVEPPTAFEASGYRQETLSDGSIVDLNAGAHVMVQFSAGERRVVLVQGEAQFTVSKNPRRPFVVRAGGVDVRAVGTAFNVKLAGPQLEVLVTEGKVEVTRQPGITPAVAATRRTAVDDAPAARILAEIAAGHRVVLAVPGVAVGEPRPEVVPASRGEIDELLAWKPRLLDFDSTPLAEVVATFNRRNAVQMEIADERLRELPIVASIRSDNVAGFVRLLEATMGVRAEQAPGGIIRLRAAR